MVYILYTHMFSNVESIFHVCVHISSCNIIQYLFGCTCLRCKIAIIISFIVIRIIIIIILVVVVIVVIGVVVVVIVVVTIMMTIIMFMYLCPSVCTHTHTHVSILIRTPTKFFCRSPQGVPHGFLGSLTIHKGIDQTGLSTVRGT